VAGPFPGMDPYIESQGNWQDFHNNLISEMRYVLGARLPDDYVARTDEAIEVVRFDGPEGTSYKPDFLAARGEKPLSPSRSAEVSEWTPTEPMLMDVAVRDPEAIRHTWLEIRRLPDLEQVTVVEVLSPTNKTWPGREQYLQKREDLHARKVHLVEIDLLLGGLRVPMKDRLREGHYFAIVARGPMLPTAEVYRWTVRDRLPPIPIPLSEHDPDAFIDLQSLVDRVYDLGRYRRTLRYDRSLPDGTALDPHDRAWAEAGATAR
jgi:hypothetical protein